jgi:thiosulfate/3-mercaptopyruvate sulfurtransferase
MTSASTVLVTAAQLCRRLSASTRGGVGDSPLILDVRWALGDPNGHQHYLRGHLPGARFVDLDRELAAAPGSEVGRHPLPRIDDLQTAARSWGMRHGQEVVVYDDTGGLAAARAWWLLRWAGVPGVHLLDGGLGAWTSDGGALDEGPPPGTVTGDVVLTAGHLPVLDGDAAALLARRSILFDARAGARYRGETEPIDLRAGHIPGAISAPTTENLADDGTFRSPDELRVRFAGLGAEADEHEGAVGVYCGSGVTAAHQVAALAIGGIPAALYPGSWSQWCADPDRPVATGAQPG